MSEREWNAMRAYLEATSGDAWHVVAWEWNWDGGIEPLEWIVAQPMCDRATALLVYWYGGAGYDARYASRDDVPAYELDVHDLLHGIEQRYLSGFYTRQELAFDPTNDDGEDWTRLYDDLPKRRTIPAVMLEALQGRTLERPSYMEGYPPEVCKALGWT
jgi:hypothetical protein